MLLGLRTDPPIVETAITGVDAVEGIDNTIVGDEIDRILKELGVTWEAFVIHDGLMVRSKTEDPETLTSRMRTMFSNSGIFDRLNVVTETI